MSPLFRSVLNALMGKSESRIREVFFDERDFIGLQHLLDKNSITLSELGKFMNFYPGVKGAKCHEQAFFISLQDQPRGARIKLKENLSFDETMKEVVRHCQGSCSEVTREIFILTDQLDGPTLDFWRRNLEQIQRRGIKIEFHFIAGDMEIEIHI